MATKYGTWGWVDGSGTGWRSELVYTTSQTDTTFSINATLRLQCTGQFNIENSAVSGTLSIGDRTTTRNMPTSQSYGPNNSVTIITMSRTYERGTRNYNVDVSGAISLPVMEESSSVSVTLSVPRFSYPVTYDANGGDASSVPAAQTKWWGTNLTLSSTVPTRLGCTFLGWATAADGTGTAYAPGQVYTGNHALTLYAVWLGASVPIIDAERSDADGDEDDDGTYGTLTASWQAVGTPTATVSVVAVNVTTGDTIALSGDVSGTKAAQQALTGAVSSLFGAEESQSGALDPDTRYTVRVTVSVTAGGAYSGRTVTATGTAYISLAYIAIDALAGGHGVSIGKPANREGFDVALDPFYAKVPAQHDTDLSTSTIASIIAVDSSVATVTSAYARTWGKVAQLVINWTNVSAISVPANGNIANVTIGTLVDGLRPAILTAGQSYGDAAGAAWYAITNQGVVQLGAMEGTGTERTVAANTTFNLLCTYILP